MLLSLPRVNSPDGWAPSGFIGKPVEHGVTAGFANLKQDPADEGKYPARRKSLVLDPRLRVIDQAAQCNGNFMECNSEIAFAHSEFAGPPPNVTEHASVQILYEFLAKRITMAVERPVLRPRDVLLFGFVKLVAIGDMRRETCSVWCRSTPSVARMIARLMALRCTR